MAQKCIISGGAFQTPAGAPLAFGTVQVALQNDVMLGTVQLCAGIKTSLQLDSSGSVTGSPTLWGPVTYLITPFSAKGERAIGPLSLSITIPNAASFSLTPA